MVVALKPKFIWAFAKFNGIAWLRESPANIIVNAISPICLLTIIYFLSNGVLLPYAIVGGAIAIVAASSLSTTGQSAMFRLEFRIQDLLIATKVNVLDYILAFSLSNIIFSTPGITFFLVLGVIFHLFSLQRLAMTIIVVFLVAIATTSIAVMVGSRIRRTIGMWAISGILSSLLTLIPPTFYPYTVLPKPLLYIFALSPITPAAIVLQGAYGLRPVDAVMLPLLVVEVAVYMVLAVKLSKWSER
jgi:ABC-2 type transport system permease protein